jgi:hypothetical protein
MDSNTIIRKYPKNTDDFFRVTFINEKFDKVKYF